MRCLKGTYALFFRFCIHYSGSLQNVAYVSGNKRRLTRGALRWIDTARDDSANGTVFHALKGVFPRVVFLSRGEFPLLVHF
ncbi:hypothetical protein NY2A_b848L [Paramecium bursaria Chlorella virus NY2A]|uniref:Uncharacterized protein b848L n=1 Tax=Paramecium bursaria Chlorella virus NY2A TaxID=46021 RepID=A7IY23_PBCVN|nr:hypothetical protein NY2A_b848L [Paramecium bursaria Chlorella virus NY2A]ABT15247.1 hypothetical protein NY2A_b848L [Paramecium bursaria Chlorella virus NY2A]